MQLPVLLRPIGRVEQVDPADHGAQQARVGRGHPVGHRPQEQGHAGGRVGDVDRLPAPPAGLATAWQRVLAGALRASGAPSGEPPVSRGEFS
jgi:hypothetical protein